MFGRLTATIEVARPHNMFAAAACTAAGYYLAGGRSIAEITFPLVFSAFTVAFGNLINDCYDADIDRVNKPRRPIPSGRLSIKYVRSLYWIGTIVVTVTALYCLPLELACIIAIWEMLLFLYALRVKRLLVLGYLLVVGVQSSAFLFGAIAEGNAAAVTFPVFFAFLFVMGRELVKGAEDVEGDRLAGAATLPVRLGEERTSLIAVCFLLTCVVVAPLPVLLEQYKLLYIIIMEFLVVPGLLVSSYFVLRHPRRKVLYWVSWTLKIEMFFGIAAMGLGKV